MTKPLLSNHIVLDQEYYDSVPKEYADLVDATIGKLGIENIPQHFFTVGRQRYEKGRDGQLKEGKPGYLKETPFGLLNQCFLPETDTMEEIEQEAVDCLFNLMVMNFKRPDSEHVEELLELMAEFLNYFHKTRRWGQLYVEQANGQEEIENE